MSLRYRIALTVLVLEAVMVGLVLWQVLGLTYDRTAAQIEKTDQGTLSLLSDFARAALLTREFEDLQIQFEQVTRDPHVAAVFLLRHDGRIVASSDMAMVGQNLLQEDLPDAHYWRHREIVGASGRIGEIAMKFSNAALLESGAEARNLGLAVAAASMTMIAAVGLLLGFAISRRLETLANVADQAASGDFSKDADVSGRDEVARVGRSFNMMLKKTRDSLTELEERIAEQARGQAALKASEERFKNLYDSAEVCIWNEDFSEVRVALDQLRRDGVIDLRRHLKEDKRAAWEIATAVKVTNVNNATLRLFGAETAEELIDSIGKTFGADSIDVFIEELCAIWEKKKVFRSEATFVTLGGEELTAIISMPIPETEEGYRSVPVSILDITERKRAEEKLKESEERLRVAFENFPVGNIVINDKGIIETFNNAAENIFGYPADEVIGRNVNMLMPEPDRNRHDGYIGNYLETGEARIIGIGREVTGLRKNGEEFPMQLGVGEMRIGGKVSFTGSINDLSEVKALEEQLRHAQRMEAVGQLTGGVAHDFNNLLAIMINNAELLEDGVGEDEEARECIEEIIAAIDRGSSLTHRLLAFSRKQALSPVAADISHLIGSLHDMLQRTLGETVELKVEPTADLWPATIDPHQFENALVNLAINARDAMPKGGTLTIETANVTLDKTYAGQHEEVTPGDYVMVAVSDSGTGMPPGVLEKVFEPFFTTKEVGQGSGLGLSMVYGFVKQSKGHITIYSELDHGTTVKLYMPRSRESAAKTDAENDATEFARGSERILVVEDDPKVRKGSVKILGEHGYEVVEAGNGEEAIGHLKSGQTFDLLFTDVVLPGGMNGVEIAAEAKRLRPGIKVLYATGYAESAAVHNGQLDPGVILVNKPYRRAELLEKVRTILDSDGD